MLNGKTAIVTGGSRGIGAAVARKLASLGADIAVIYAGNQEKAEAVCEECRTQYGVRAESFCCNVADFDAVKQTVAAVKQTFGHVEILINNAGINRDGLVAMMPEADFDAVVDTNLKGTFHMIRHCARLFIRQGYGRIVNLSSVAGVIGNAGQANYAASKAGVIGLTKSVAKELAAKNVTCNAIAPGFVRTPMTDVLKDEYKAEILKQISLGRLGEPEDIANAVSFLVSDKAAYITGQVLVVSGGMPMGI